MLFLICAGCQPEGDTGAGTAHPSTTDPEPEVIEIPAAPQPRLDLSREHLQNVDGEGQVPSEPEQLLPDFFAEQDAIKEQDNKKMKVNGGLLTNPEAANLKDSIDGVEIRVEMSTQ